MDKDKRYNLQLTNRNGYTIKMEGNNIDSLKQRAKIYPLSVFFGWVYDRKTDQMLYQNDYTNKWKKCNNESFIPYW